jgi:cold shock CspA family protein
MTGTIKSLDAASGCGAIASEDGLIVAFGPSEVLAYDVSTLAVGQVVNFNLRPGKRPRAANVLVQRALPTKSPQEKQLGVMRLRYVGFEQRGAMRSYLFEGLTPEAERRAFTVQADLALFARHHVGVQEGPSLCLHWLESLLGKEGASARLHHTLSEEQMVAYVATRPAPRARHGHPNVLPSTGAR